MLPWLNTSAAFGATSLRIMLKLGRGRGMRLLDAYVGIRRLFLISNRCAVMEFTSNEYTLQMRIVPLSSRDTHAK
jgi:hypothetical protein